MVDLIICFCRCFYQVSTVSIPLLAAGGDEGAYSRICILTFGYDGKGMCFLISSNVPSAWGDSRMVHYIDDCGRVHYVICGLSGAV